MTTLRTPIKPGNPLVTQISVLQNDPSDLKLDEAHLNQALRAIFDKLPGPTPTSRKVMAQSKRILRKLHLARLDTSSTISPPIRVPIITLEDQIRIRVREWMDYSGNPPKQNRPTIVFSGMEKFDQAEEPDP
jgi:hypothetical protein